MSLMGRPGVEKRQPPVSVRERIDWAYARWQEAVKRAERQPRDVALAVARDSRKRELYDLIDNTGIRWNL